MTRLDFAALLSHYDHRPSLPVDQRNIRYNDQQLPSKLHVDVHPTGFPSTAMLVAILFFFLGVSAVPTRNAYSNFELGEGFPSLASLNMTIADLAARSLPSRKFYSHNVTNYSDPSAQTASVQYDTICGLVDKAYVRMVATSSSKCPHP